ncbi:hypothetical protein [Halobellus salinisoli]|uniref:hypothetical protein n=1 Tax=Halobellus salinisoli TaxID=3108500 RepID=UPI003009CEB1
MTTSDTTDFEPDVTTAEAIPACQRQLPDAVGGGNVVFGFDGFVDSVQRMVDTRRDPESYTPIRTLDSLADRFRASADENSSIAIEWVNDGTRLGGHTSHLTRFYGGIGYDPTLVGTFGTPPRETFQTEFGEYEMVSIGEPGETHAVEFDDGKCMLIEPGSYLRFDWESFSERISPTALAERIDGTDLFGIGYWTVMPRLPAIIDGIREEVWPMLSDPPEEVLFDPGDIRQLPDEQIQPGIEALERLASVTSLTVSANRVETLALADMLTTDDPGRSFTSAVTTVYDHVDVTRFVGHNVDFSVSVSDAGTARVDVPKVAEPEITTSAGDHFNAGLSLGLLQGLDDPASLVLGNAVANHFVRTGSPPAFDEIVDVVHEYEELLSV